MTAVIAASGSTVMLCTRGHLSAKSAQTITDALERHIPDLRFVIVEDVEDVVVHPPEQDGTIRGLLESMTPVNAVRAAAGLPKYAGPDDDLTVAATRMHDALFRVGEAMDDLGVEVTVAYGQLQQALKRRGWEPWSGPGDDDEAAR